MTRPDIPPPNLRAADSCRTCAFLAWRDRLGLQANCLRHDCNVVSGQVCDDFEPEEG